MNIYTVADALRTLADALQAEEASHQTEPVAPAPAAPAPAPAAPAQAPAPAAPAQAPAPAAPEVELSLVVSLMKNLQAEKGTDAVKAILQKHSLRRLTEADRNTLFAIYQELQA